MENYKQILLRSECITRADDPSRPKGSSSYKYNKYIKPIWKQQKSKIKKTQTRHELQDEARAKSPEFPQSEELSDLSDIPTTPTTPVSQYHSLEDNFNTKNR